MMDFFQWIILPLLETTLLLKWLKVNGINSHCIICIPCHSNNRFALFVTVKPWCSCSESRYRADYACFFVLLYSDQDSSTASQLWRVQNKNKSTAFDTGQSTIKVYSREQKLRGEGGGREKGTAGGAEERTKVSLSTQKIHLFNPPITAPAPTP